MHRYVLEHGYQVCRGLDLPQHWRISVCLICITSYNRIPMTSDAMHWRRFHVSQFNSGIFVRARGVMALRCSAQVLYNHGDAASQVRQPSLSFQATLSIALQYLPLFNQCKDCTYHSELTAATEWQAINTHHLAKATNGGRA
jgi:hypothetical protein